MIVPIRVGALWVEGLLANMDQPMKSMPWENIILWQKRAVGCDLRRVT